MQKFFKYLAISSKIDHVVSMAMQELEQGNCVVIGLQSTGEAATDKDMLKKMVDTLPDLEEDEAVDVSDLLDTDIRTSQFSSAAGKVVKSVVTKLMPCQHGAVCDPAKCAERKDVWKMVMDLVPALPSCSLDMLIEQLGGPVMVAEMTGRKKGLERGGNRIYTNVKRVAKGGSQEQVNMLKK